MSNKPNEGALEIFMHQLRFRMNQIEAQLQTEESGNKIAFLQGNCGGFRSLIAALKETGYEDYTNVKASETLMFEYLEKDDKWVVKTGKYSVLIDWNQTAYDIEEVLSEAKKPLESRINKMKDRLFYDAEKGRDLHFVKGWYCILSCFYEWCEKIHQAYDIAKKEHDNSLDFGEDDENPFKID